MRRDTNVAKHMAASLA